MKCYSRTERDSYGRAEDDGIYDPNYQSFVLNDRRYIGRKVRVVKGRKFPIGSTYTIKDFYTYRVNSRNTVEYAIMTTGEKIKLINLELVTPIALPLRLMGCYEISNPYCPNCGARLPEPRGSGYSRG